MSTISLFHVNAFSRQPFSGNPAVVALGPSQPDATLLAMAADAHARQRAEQASRLEAAAQQAAGPQSGEGAAGETQASCDGGAVSQAASTVLPCQMVDGAGSLPQS